MTRPTRAIPESLAFARRLAYLWVWGVARKLRTSDPHAILSASDQSSIKLRLRDIRVALQIGAPSFEIPPLKVLHAAMLGQGDRAAAVDQIVAAALSSQQLQDAVRLMLGEETPAEAGPAKLEDRLPEIKPAKVVDPGPSGFEQEIADQIAGAVHLAGRHKEMFDAPDILTDPENPPEPEVVLEQLTVDLVHNYYRAKRDKDTMHLARVAKLLITASATRFAIKRFAQAEGSGAPTGYDNARALPPISVPSAE